MDTTTTITTISQYSDPLPFGLGFQSFDVPETSPISDSNTTTTTITTFSQYYVPETSPMSDSSNNHRAVSDEEILLASDRPKKRAGRKKFRETRHPIYRGVRRRNLDRWVCEVREPNKKSRIWLGTFPTAEMAARAHDVAALALRGRSACLNFADSAWRLPVPVSANAKDIQKAAAEAAEAFRASESDQGVVSAPEKRAENLISSSPEDVFYMDEEAVFGMPDLIANMAEGLLLSPPPCIVGGFNSDDVERGGDVSLWSY